MSEIGENSDERSRGNVTSFMDVPYPRKIWDKIRNGDEIDFQELIKTGMVIVFITPYEDEVNRIQNHIKDWAKRNKESYVVVDFESDQKFLNRFLEINKNNGRIDYAGLNELFEKICLYSSVLSEHQDEEHPNLISYKTRIIKFNSGKYTAYYLAISSHPDLIEDQRLEQLMDHSRQRFETNIKKTESNNNSSNSEKEGITTNVFNVTIGEMNNSNLQVGTINSNQTIQQNDLDLINDLIKQLENSVETLNGSDKEKILTQIESIKSQTKSKSPNRQIVTDGLKSIHGILQAIPSAHSTVTTIISNLEPILKSLGVS